MVPFPPMDFSSRNKAMYSERIFLWFCIKFGILLEIGVRPVILLGHGRVGQCLFFRALVCFAAREIVSCAHIRPAQMQFLYDPNSQPQMFLSLFMLGLCLDSQCSAGLLGALTNVNKASSSSPKPERNSNIKVKNHDYPLLKKILLII